MDNLLDQVVALVTEWQATLHMLDWSVKVRQQSISDDRLGESLSDHHNQTGAITIPDDYESRYRKNLALARWDTVERDLEDTVVHELCHIGLSPFLKRLRDDILMTVGDGTAGQPLLSALETAEEGMICWITRQLIDQKYRSTGDGKNVENTNQPTFVGHASTFVGDGSLTNPFTRVHCECDRCRLYPVDPFQPSIGNVGSKPHP